MRIGAVEHVGTTDRVRVRAVAADAPDANQDLRFRDLVRGDVALVAAYVATKRAMLAAGMTVPNDYTVAKCAFVERSGGTGSAAPNLAEDG